MAWFVIALTDDDFADFRAAIQDGLDRVPTTHASKLTSLMTLSFQEFDDVSLLAARNIALLDGDSGAGKSPGACGRTAEPSDNGR